MDKDMPMKTSREDAPKEIHNYERINNNANFPYHISYILLKCTTNRFNKYESRCKGKSTKMNDLKEQLSMASADFYTGIMIKILYK